MTRPSPKKDSVRQRKKSEATAVQKFLPLAEIRQDTVVLKNGGIRAILSVVSTNFSLKSEDEQQAIINSYQEFLNTLTFPLQIVVRSMKLNVDGYVADLMKRAEGKRNPLLREQTIDYARFIERLVDISEIMQKRFYAVVPVDPPGLGKASFFQKYMGWLAPGDTRAKALARKRLFDGMSVTLRDRVNIVRTGLEQVGLAAERLTTMELIELFYQTYNPKVSQEEKLAGAGTGALGVKEYVL